MKPDANQYSIVYITRCHSNLFKKQKSHSQTCLGKFVWRKKENQEKEHRIVHLLQELCRDRTRGGLAEKQIIIICIVSVILVISCYLFLFFSISS